MLLFVTRSEGWFLKPPYPAAILVGAIVATQLLAVVLCAFGILVPAISWSLIGWVWLYNIMWIFLLGGVRQRLGESLSAFALYSFRWQDSNNPQSEYDEHRFGVGLFMEF